MSDDPITASSAGINDTIPSGPLQGKDGEGTGSNTTIHTERYTAWKGTLENRRNIVGRTIHQGFRHILSNKWVKILIVLTWIFNVVFPLLFAFFGMNNLMQSSGDENVYGEENDPYEIIKSYDVGFPLSKTIKPRETAVYPISVINAGEKTDIVHVWISYQDEGWSASFISPGDFLNITDEGENATKDRATGNEEEVDEGKKDEGEDDGARDGDDDPYQEEPEYFYEMNFTLTAGELTTFGLVIVSPEGLVSGKGVVRVETRSLGAESATTGMWEGFEVMSEIDVITVVGQTEGSPYHFIMTTDSRTMTNREVTAGDEISFPVTITNTGSQDETFVIKVDGLPNNWHYRFEGLDELADNIAKNEIGVYLQPGENRTFSVIYDTPKYPGKSSFIGVSAYSVNDPSLSGGVVTIVEARDIPDRDMTAILLADPESGIFGFLFMMFALFLAAVAGSKAISEDLAQKSFTIYFSRPIKKQDYIAIKFGSVGAVMCLGTMVPILVTYAGLILLSDVNMDYIIDHLWVWGAIILHSLLIVTVLTSISLAFSSLTVRRFYAAFGLVVSYMISAIISGIMKDSFNEDRGSVVSIYYSIQMVGAKIFDVPDITYDYEWTYNFMFLLTIILICISVIMVKVWKTELSE